MRDISWQTLFYIDVSCQVKATRLGPVSKENSFHERNILTLYIAHTITVLSCVYGRKDFQVFLGSGVYAGCSNQKVSY